MSVHLVGALTRAFDVSSRSTSVLFSFFSVVLSAHGASGSSTFSFPHVRVHWVLLELYLAGSFPTTLPPFWTKTLVASFPDFL